MTDLQPIKFIQSAFTKRTIELSSDKSTKDLYEELKSVMDKSNNIFTSVNLSGKINDEYIFEVTHKRESLVISIGGYAGMSSELTGQLVENGSTTKIIATIKPNTYFRLAFIGFFLGGLFSLSETVIFRTPDNSPELSIFCLLLACPMLVFLSYNAKKELVHTFITTFKLTKEPSNEK